MKEDFQIPALPSDAGAPSAMGMLPMMPPTAARVGASWMMKTAPGCFNPGLAEYRGRLVMAWRQGWSDAVICIGELDRALEIVNPQRLDFTKWIPCAGAAFEDPRLFCLKGRLHLSFTVVRGALAEMAVARLDGNLEPVEMWLFKGNPPCQEKNWQFFEYGGVPQVVYLVNPHQVSPVRGGRVMFQNDAPCLKWEHGDARGGTPPVRIGEECFAFFHSSWKGLYVAGFYGFEAAPPFRVTRWPVAPCLVSEHDAWRAGGGPAVVFPAGAVFRDGIWTVSFGWHDTWCRLARWSHQELLSTLRPAAECRLSGRWTFGSHRFALTRLSAKARGA